MGRKPYLWEPGENEEAIDILQVIRPSEKEIKMKRFEELAKATKEYRNYLIAVAEKAGERIMTSVDITTVRKPSIFVEGAFREIIKNSDQVKKKMIVRTDTLYIGL